MARATSRDAYAQLLASGKLKGQYAELQRLVVDADGATASEILSGTHFAKNKNAAMARFTELRERGLIVEGPIRECSVTGRMCLTWEATTRTKPLGLKRGKGTPTKAALIRLATELGAYVVHHSTCRSDECDCGLEEAQSALARARA